MKVPQQQEQCVSEDAILDMLGPRGPVSPTPVPFERETRASRRCRPETHDWASAEEDL